MYMKALPPELIITDFVENENLCNYEKYLLEFVNKSPFFSSKSNKQQYHAPPSESNGECDCISDTYELDFKLIASQSLLRAVSDLTRRKTLLCPGVVAINSPKKRNNSQIATHIYAVLQEFSYTELCKLRESQINGIADQSQKDVFQLLLTLDKKKNLLLFLPYIFYPPNRSKFSFGIVEIQNKLNSYFQNTMKYRKDKVKGFDTYMACLYDDHILFMKEHNGLLTCVDSVKLCDSPTYVELAKYAD